MIMMVSGRCDIVAFYSQWFIKRYHSGFVDVRNPFYHQHVSRIEFKDVDAIMFCTKNPLPIIDFLPHIKQPIIFHVTLTPYKKDIEPNVIDKRLIIEGIKKISNLIGSNNLYVRYDPILINDKYTLKYHINAFDRLCQILKGYIKAIIISFVDDYKNVRCNAAVLKLRELNQENEIPLLAKSFVASAAKNNIMVQTCGEADNLSQYGFIIDDCISKNLAYQLTGKKYKKWNARKSKYCHCVELVDIGTYNTCPHFCKYCYANYSEKEVRSNMQKHNINSSLLLGEIQEEDIIKKRE